MDFSIFRPQNLSKSEPIYAYKRYAYKKKHVFALFQAAYGVEKSSKVCEPITFKKILSNF